MARPPRQRHALVEPEQRAAPGRLVLDDDLDVGDLFAELGGQRVDCVVDELLERFARVDAQFAQRPSLVRRRMPSRACTARSSWPSRIAAQTNEAPTISSGTANRTITMTTATVFTIGIVADGASSQSSALAAMWLAMYRASRPTPPTFSDVNEYRKSSPRK